MHDPNLLHFVFFSRLVKFHFFPFSDGSVFNGQEADDASERVEPRVKEKRLQRSTGISTRPEEKGEERTASAEHATHAGMRSMMAESTPPMPAPVFAEIYHRNYNE